MEEINLAHGSLFALGAYFALSLLGPGRDSGRSASGMGGRAVREAIRGALSIGPVMTALVGMVLEL